MNPGLPDWMFAAFAIGGWELFDWLAQHLMLPQLHWVGGSIVAVSLLVLVVRYIVRFVKRMKYKEEPDPDEWKNY